ncbi:MAG: Mitochondrial distribution and morphology protein 31, mitochondrial precursor [Candelina mexicana]|nr:MAG: Mitochondrial distribution and morphology protein 31, mitochondrial precursor [Candelina mexicana]
MSYLGALPPAEFSPSAQALAPLPRRPPSQLVTVRWKRYSVLPLVLRVARGSQLSRRQRGEETHIATTEKVSMAEGKAVGATSSPKSKSNRKATSIGAAGSVTERNILERLPHMPHIPQIHRPSKEELLAAATGFWSRLKVRFKWFSIRSARPFNMDEIGAFFSWFVVGHVIWILVGTTTFFSLAILTINTVFAQETLARWIGNYLTKSSGVKVVFESAIVPKWGDGVITFKNVFVSRRPGQGKSRVIKGSQVSAAAAAAAAAERAKEAGDIREPAFSGVEGEEDSNYTQFDLSIDTVNVTLSFAKWFNSKGLLRDVEVKGVRGEIDRTSVHYNGDYVDPRIYKHEHHPGDFEINSFKMEDLLVTVYQPRNFRPFSVSIFSCDLPQLRKQWLFYDFLSANTMSGSFDNSLFTIHPRQIQGYTSGQLNHGVEVSGEADPWKKHSRLRIDGLNIDHLNRGVEGPFSWIHQGNVDIVADVMFPADNHETIAKVMSDFYDRMEATVTSDHHRRPNGGTNVAQDQIPTTREQTTASGTETTEDEKRFLVMDLRVHLSDVHAAVPLFTRDLSYVRNALIRPIVAYINSKKAFIPVNCRVVKSINEFDGSWTIFDSGLMDDISAETYEAFARDVVDDQARRRRFKKVGLWSLQLAIQALFMGMVGSNIA